jgi:nitroimidazol reductase NimA-like FMN-containing flavoprotein (pyridoxamine 5'-phosphate oxidase superfamily)
MDHVEYVYTVGMTTAAVDTRLREAEHGVLALARDDEAYAVPISLHYDGTRLLLRVSSPDGDGGKAEFLETTERATLVCYEASTADSWSVTVRGPVEPADLDPDDAQLNEWFQPFRLFDEAVPDTAFTLYELRMEEVVGRRTAE